MNKKYFILNIVKVFLNFLLHVINYRHFNLYKGVAHKMFLSRTPKMNLLMSFNMKSLSYIMWLYWYQFPLLLIPYFRILEISLFSLVKYFSKIFAPSLEYSFFLYSECSCLWFYTNCFWEHILLILLYILVLSVILILSISLYF